MRIEAAKVARTVALSILEGKEILEGENFDTKDVIQ